MAIEHVFAYFVTPQRTSSSVSDPEGGSVPVTEDLGKVLNESNEAARFPRQTEVTFEVDRSTRTNEVRDAIRQLAFAKHRQAESAALQLARRLSAAMDSRSAAGLFICSTERINAAGLTRVTLWTFPRDSAFQLSHRDGAQRVRVLRDVFSQTSGLRKAAMFEGRDLRNHFLTGRALDFQAGGNKQDIAEFWIKRFLMCRFGLKGEAGTRMLANALRVAYDHCPDPEDQEQLYGAVMALRVAPPRQHSIESIAETYLSGNAREALIKALPDESHAALMFELQPPVLERTLNFRVFELVTGVVVSSPFGAVGETVVITEGDRRHLTCEGEVKSEKLRKRHAS